MGPGITVIPSSTLTVKHQNKRLAVVNSSEPVSQRRTGMARRKGFTRPAALDALRDVVQSLKIPGLIPVKSS